VCVPLAAERGWEELEELARAVALRLARDEPEAFTANMARAQRKGRIFVDYLRNVRGANAVGPYSTRAREGAPVATPLDWDELDRLSGPTDFTVAEVPLRVLGFGVGRPADPWARYLECRQRVPEPLARELLA
jgi:bifunctional non-homologous end joining protein LigD